MTASKKNPSAALAGIAAVLKGATVEQALAISGVKPLDKKAQAAADKAKMLATAKALEAAAPAPKAKQPIAKPDGTRPMPKSGPVKPAPKGKTDRAPAAAKPSPTVEKAATKPAGCPGV